MQMRFDGMSVNVTTGQPSGMSTCSVDNTQLCFKPDWCVMPMCPGRAVTVIARAEGEKLCLSDASQVGFTEFCLGQALQHPLLALGRGLEAPVHLEGNSSPM